MWRALLLTLLISINTVEADNLTAIAEQLQTPALLQGSFSQHKHIRILSAPLVSGGVFSIVRDYGVIWGIKEPMQTQLLITENGVIGEDVDNDRAMAYIGRILKHILSGELSALQKQFDITLTDSEQYDWALQMKPRSAILGRAINRIELAGDTHIRRLVLHEAEGDRTEIRFFDFSHSDRVDSDISDVFPSSR